MTNAAGKLTLACAAWAPSHGTTTLDHVMIAFALNAAKAREISKVEEPENAHPQIGRGLRNLILAGLVQRLLSLSPNR